LTPLYQNIRSSILPRRPSKRYSKPMTIAAGLICNGSVLLCADTLYTSTAQTHDKKVDHFEYPGGKVALAVAGHTVHAWSAVTKLKMALRNLTDSSRVISVSERVLAAQFTAKVSQHPDRASDYHDTLGYSLLLVFWSEGEGLQFYYTSELTMTPITSGFQCIGSGADLANNLIKPVHSSSMEPRTAWHLAAYALKACKENVNGCGGTSLFLVIEKDGTIGITSTDFQDSEDRQIEDFYRVYEYLTRSLLMSMANPKIDNSIFWDHTLKAFAKKLMDQRLEWGKSRIDWEEDFKSRNRAFHPSGLGHTD
jgi:20S proteasome alpha/beta subunit